MIRFTVVRHRRLASSIRRLPADKVDARLAECLWGEVRRRFRAKSLDERRALCLHQKHRMGAQGGAMHSCLRTLRRSGGAEDAQA